MSEPSTVLVTGGSGFIGRALVERLLTDTQAYVVNVDRQTYAAAPLKRRSEKWSERYCLIEADVADQAAMAEVLVQHQPSCVFHLAAESHVDRSISGPDAFLHSNVVGTWHWYPMVGASPSLQMRHITAVGKGLAPETGWVLPHGGQRATLSTKKLHPHKKLISTRALTTLRRSGPTCIGVVVFIFIVCNYRSLSRWLVLCKWSVLDNETAAYAEYPRLW